MAQETLRPDVARAYLDLRRRYAKDPIFRAVVDMYRNVSFEPEVAAHFMADHDMRTYVHGGGPEFRPLTAGYEQREIEFLVQRGIKLI